MMIRYQAEPAEVLIPSAKALRYAGQGTQPPAPEVERLFSSCMEEFLGCTAYRAVSLEVELARRGNAICLSSLCVKSESLTARLADCGRALLFCATVGGGLDRLLLRYGKTQPSRAVLLDAIGSAAIEAWCDTLTGDWTRELEARGFALRCRFSPGYGDFSLFHQNGLLSLLSAAQTTGVSAAASRMLVPQKSVTAVIGLYEKQE